MKHSGSASFVATLPGPGLTDKINKRNFRVKRTFSGHDDMGSVMKLKQLVSNTLPRSSHKQRHKERSCVPKSTQTNDVTDTGRFHPGEDEELRGQASWVEKTGDKLDYYFDGSVNSSPDYSPQDGPFECVHYDSDGAYTLPKGRSRIKTNPWLPSPTTSGMTSPLTSSSEAESANQMTVFDFTRYDPFRQSKSLFSPNASMTESGFYSCGTPDTVTFEDLQQNSGYFDTVRNCSQDCFSDGDGEKRISLSGPSSIQGENNGKGDGNTTRLQHHAHGHGTTIRLQRQNNVQPSMDYDYEEIFEQNIEHCNTATIGSRDDLITAFQSRDTSDDIDSDLLNDRSRTDPESEDHCYNEFSTELEQEHQYFDEFNNDFQSDFDCDIDLDTIQATCQGRKQNRPISDMDFEEQRLHSSQFTHAKLPSQTSTYQRDRPPQTNNSTDARLKYLKYLDSCSQHESSGPYSASDYSKYLHSKTELHSVRTNLQERIQELRREKVLIDELVRKAREEEEIKRAVRMRMQRDATLAMKQVLLATLRDLKENLASQTDRLQSSYEQILAFQYERVKRE